MMPSNGISHRHQDFLSAIIDDHTTELAVLKKEIKNLKKDIEKSKNSASGGVGMELPSLKKRKVVHREYGFDHPMIKVVLCIGAVYGLVYFGSGVLYLIEGDERQAMYAEDRSAYLLQVEHIRNSTLLSPKVREDFINYLGDEPLVLTDIETANEYLLFSFSIISTIGYGNISPLGFNSQWFVVFYALIGIPIAGILFTSAAHNTLMYFQNLIYGDSLVTIFKDYVKRGGGSGHLNRAELKEALKELGYSLSEDDFEIGFRHADDGDGKINEPEFLSFIEKISWGDDLYEREKTQAFAVACVFMGYWVIGGFLFSNLEDWDMDIALYFSMITLTTVGLGDYYPSTSIGTDILILYGTVGLGIVATMLELGLTFFKHKAEKKLAEQQHRAVKFTREASQSTNSNTIGLAARKFSQVIKYCYEHHGPT
jgi:hypothetical protein